MNVDFFEKAYQSIYEQCSQLYDQSDLSLNYKITRVDSTMVAQTASELENGINVGRKKDGKKQVKYTIALTDIFPSSVEVFTQQNFISENLTIPQTIQKVIDKNKDNVFVFDRGVSSRSAFCDLDSNGYSFVTRLRTDTRYLVLEGYNIQEGLRVNNLTVIKDQRVNLYRTGPNIVDHSFRLIQTVNQKGIPYWFLSNRLDLTCQEIILIYKKRWDIEVFFRFIKQELNFSHFISVNENGIKIILYMTMILAMLILIYKKINGFGYKTAKRRFAMELEEIIDDYLIEYCGGDPNTYFW
jgi:transposase